MDHSATCHEIFCVVWLPDCGIVTQRQVHTIVDQVKVVAGSQHPYRTITFGMWFWILTAYSKRTSTCLPTGTKHASFDYVKVVVLLEVQFCGIVKRRYTLRLREGSLRICGPAWSPVLTLQHRQAQVHFAQEHKGWPLRYWIPVLLTDETLFQVFTFGCVWGHQGENHAECNIV